MSEIATNQLKTVIVAEKIDFVVNEFQRIKVPAAKKVEPEDFRDMSTIQRQIIMKRLIEKVNDL